MADPPSEKDVKAPNVFQRAKEEVEAIVHSIKQSNSHQKETHGLRDDINEGTAMDDVKAPNLFERTKEEIEALVQTVQHRNESISNSDDGSRAESKSEKQDLHAGAEKDVKAPNLLVRVKEEMEAIMHKEKLPHHHDRENHGTSNDIDENTPISEVKAPNVFERAKEEIESLVQTIHPNKKESDNDSSPKGSGFRKCIGECLEQVCCPKSHKKD